MFTLNSINTDIVTPGLALLPAKFDSREARAMILAIGQQESRFKYRVQRPLRTGMSPGPARGFWQFERMGGVKGVMTHASTAGLAGQLCADRCVRPQFMAVWNRLAEDDALACAFARLLLYSDPRPLPKLGDERGAWDYYFRNWRPGKPHRQTWGRFYQEALGVVA